MTLPHLTQIVLILKMLLPSLLGNTRTKMTHRQHIKQDKHSSHHRLHMCFFNNGGHPKGQIRDDERLPNF
jgi:hypothetical protein